MSYQKQIFVLTTLGLATGSFIYLIMGYMGLSIVIAQSVVLFSALKYFGAAYLMYIGVKSLVQNQKPGGVGEISAAPISDIRPMQAYRIGVLTNLSNPRAALYYLALFTSVMLPNTPTGAKIIILIILPILTWSWYSFVAFSFSMRWFQNIYARSRKWVDRSFGGLMIFLGIRLAISSKR